MVLTHEVAQCHLVVHAGPTLPVAMSYLRFTLGSGRKKDMHPKKLTEIKEDIRQARNWQHKNASQKPFEFATDRCVDHAATLVEELERLNSAYGLALCLLADAARKLEEFSNLPMRKGTNVAEILQQEATRLRASIPVI